MIVDAHSHIFPSVNGIIGAGKTTSAGYGNIRVGDQTRRLFPAYNERTEYTVEMLIAHLDWAGVDKAVLLQGTFYGECNAFALEAADRYPDRLFAALHADPWREDYRNAFEAGDGSILRRQDRVFGEDRAVRALSRGASGR